MNQFRLRIKDNTHYSLYLTKGGRESRGNYIKQ
nr:MAG TPA: hypothetical protein [Caudoviricetes sp.]